MIGCLPDRAPPGVSMELVLVVDEPCSAGRNLNVAPPFEAARHPNFDPRDKAHQAKKGSRHGDEKALNQKTRS